MNQQQTPTSRPVSDSAITRITDSIRWSLSGAAIEQESFRIIEEECASLMTSFSPAAWRVARRLIHTTADKSIADDLIFRHNPVQAGLQALQNGAPLFCDASMIKAGLSVQRLRSLCPAYTKDSIHCFIADRDVAEQARERGTTRALICAEKARPLLSGAIVLIGNAPLALARIARYILEENIRPALVIGMPVGFVNVVESKELLLQTSVPMVVLNGRRGGSTLAVATLHAIIESASDGEHAPDCGSKNV